MCTHSKDLDKIITSRFFRFKKGESFVYTYTYHEMKIIVEGSFIISDGCGNKVTAMPGDTTSITFLRLFIERQLVLETAGPTSRRLD